MFDSIVSAFKGSLGIGSDTDEFASEESAATGAMTFLHGILEVHVSRAEDLPDTDTAFWNIDAKDKTDPFVTGFLGQACIFKTRYINNELNPVWDEHFNVDVCHWADSIRIELKDKEHIGAAHVATTSIPTDELSFEDEWFELTGANGESLGRLNMSVRYVPMEVLAEDEADKEVPRAYFPMRENNRLVLYQDADTPLLPQFEGMTFPDESPYEPTRCWKDMFEAIQGAQRFIYITGWSVYTAISLLRGEDDEDGMSNVGELLKSKADNEGVKVLMMVWNEKMSTDMMEGMMGTHDEDTRRFFADTAVECVLVPRAKSEGILASEFVSSCYTHHQKTVVCDAEDPESGLRRIVAFIGGLDITNGRYDTPEFPLFSTLQTLHKEDFYSNCVPGATQETGPREPWHDCHAKVEGEAAMDIKKNFEERWCRQSASEATQIFVPDEEEFVAPDAAAPVPDYEGGAWNLQLFRSITSDSAVFDIDRLPCLHSKGGRHVQNDIMRCMVHQIRNAKNFIYMENQYFLGSAYAWQDDQDTLSHHVVPQEITQRIVDKIRAGQMFRAYILVPMFPEGDPASAPIQEILRWQYRTMQSMYREIAGAIEESDAGTHPTDYLMFFCLGKRESPDEVPVDELAEPVAGSLVEAVRTSLRHPVYVHSKMTIVDDDYVLVGSANINQRSLGGNRDSEIAMGGYQPDHLAEEGGGPRGDVHTYRMALWSAHLGGFDEAYLDPASEECAAKVKEVSQAFWEAYTADEPEHSDVHLLPYPVTVDECGEVSNLEAPWDCFPDTSANVLGTKSGYLPAKLTT